MWGLVNIPFCLYYICEYDCNHLFYNCLYSCNEYPPLLQEAIFIENHEKNLVICMDDWQRKLLCTR